MPAHLKQVTLPAFGELSEQPKIPTPIYEARATAAYNRAGAAWLAVYADREHFGNIVFHLENRRQRKGLGGFGKEEVLGHLDISRLWEISYVIS